MGRDEVLLDVEYSEDRAEIASYLRTMADRLEETGELSLSGGGDSVDVSVPSRPVFEVKAEREHESSGTELSVEFEIEWEEDAHGSEHGGASGLSIE